MNIPIPPCATLNGTGESSERMIAVCREHATNYRETLEKYHETMFNLADEVMRKSQDRQMQRLKKLMEKETGEVMRQLQYSRKHEVKQLAQVHKDKDELERMKREVDSTLVEKGVSERVRLTANYERRRDELQKQHDAAKASLKEQKDKVNDNEVAFHCTRHEIALVSIADLTLDLMLCSFFSSHSSIILQIKATLEQDVNSQGCVSYESCMNFFNAIVPSSSMSSALMASGESPAREHSAN